MHRIIDTRIFSEYKIRDYCLRNIGTDGNSNCTLCKKSLSNVTECFTRFFPGTAKDKVFVASGNEVRGYTKKGKQFLGFDTNLAEEIKSM